MTHFWLRFLIIPMLDGIQRLTKLDFDTWVSTEKTIHPRPFPFVKWLQKKRRGE